MKKNQVISIILIIIGIPLLIIGVMLSTRKENVKTDDDFMMNTTQFFDGITCYNNLCLSNLKISNSSTKDTEVEFDLVNNNKTTMSSSTLKLRFDTGDNITFTYKSLNPKETVKIKVKTKNNLSKVMNYKLEKN